jgi:hypothetical protein
MRKIMIAALAATALAGIPAMAADLPAVAAINKALNVTGVYPYQSSGFFFGAYTEGGGGSVSANAPGVNPASLATTDAGLGFTVGYAWGQKTSKLAYSAEADFGFTNFNGNNAGFALQGPLAFEQRFVIWTPLANLTTLLPNFFGNLGIGTIPPFQALPPGVTASNLQTGLAFGVREKDVSLAYAGLQANKEWLVEPVIKLMAMEQLSNGTALRAWAGVTIPTQAHFVGPVPGSTAVRGPEVLAGAGVYF